MEQWNNGIMDIWENTTEQNENDWRFFFSHRQVQSKILLIPLILSENRKSKIGSQRSEPRDHISMSFLMHYVRLAGLSFADKL